MSINKQLAELNSKVDNLNDIAKVAKEADSKAEQALDLAKQDHYEIETLRTEVEKSKDNHNQWWIALVGLVGGFVSGFIGNFIK